MYVIVVSDEWTICRGMVNAKKWKGVVQKVTMAVCSMCMNFHSNAKKKHTHRKSEKHKNPMTNVRIK